MVFLLVRVGIKEVKATLMGEGLPANEVTIVEVLSEADYATSHVGKWHQGDIEQAHPHNQCFDYAAFPLHQQGQLALMTEEAADVFNMVATLCLTGGIVNGANQQTSHTDTCQIHINNL